MQEVRIRPTVFADALDDLAVELSRERVRRGLSLTDLARRMGWSRSRRNQYSRFERGDADADFGFDAAVRVADALGIPVLFLCGAEARQPFPQIAAPSMVPALSDMSRQRVAA